MQHLRPLAPSLPVYPAPYGIGQEAEARIRYDSAACEVAKRYPDLMRTAAKYRGDIFAVPYGMGEWARTTIATCRTHVREMHDAARVLEHHGAACVWLPPHHRRPQQ